MRSGYPNADDIIVAFGAHFNNLTENEKSQAIKRLDITADAAEDIVNIRLGRLGTPTIVKIEGYLEDIGLKQSPPLPDAPSIGQAFIEALKRQLVSPSAITTRLAIAPETLRRWITLPEQCKPAGVTKFRAEALLSTLTRQDGSPLRPFPEMEQIRSLIGDLVDIVLDGSQDIIDLCQEIGIKPHHLTNWLSLNPRWQPSVLEKKLINQWLEARRNGTKPVYTPPPAEPKPEPKPTIEESALSPTPVTPTKETPAISYIGGATAICDLHLTGDGIVQETLLLSLIKTLGPILSSYLGNCSIEEAEERCRRLQKTVPYLLFDLQNGLLCVNDVLRGDSTKLLSVRKVWRQKQ